MRIGRRLAHHGAVRVHDRLGFRGAAGRVDDHRGISRAHFGLDRGEQLVADPGVVDRVERDRRDPRAVAASDDPDRAQVGKLGDVERPRSPCGRARAPLARVAPRSRRPASCAARAAARRRRCASRCAARAGRYVLLNSIASAPIRAAAIHADHPVDARRERDPDRAFPSRRLSRACASRAHG